MKVVVADGHPTMRLGLVILLGEAGDVLVVGESGLGEEALVMVECERPDLVLLGLNLVGEMDGLETCRKIKTLSHPPYVLVHTAYDFAEDVSSCYLAGADSYLHKRAECDTLLDVVRRTVEGERVWSLGSKVGEPRSHVDAVPGGSRLTPREREVLAFLLRRYSNAEIAGVLRVSVRTVKNHVGKVFTKLGLRGRRELLEGSFGRLDPRVERRERPAP